MPSRSPCINVATGFIRASELGDPMMTFSTQAAARSKRQRHATLSSPKLKLFAALPEVDMKLTRQSKSSSTHSFSCHAGLRTNGARMLCVLAYCLIAFGVGALLVVDRLGIGARERDGKQRQG